VLAAEPYPLVAVANPTPLTFWRREVLWRTAERYGSFVVDPWGAAREDLAPKPIGMDDPRVAARVPGNARAEAFLFWSRLPVAEAKGDTVILGDQRMQGRQAGLFGVELKP
jgi:inner membrane protein